MECLRETSAIQPCHIIHMLQYEDKMKERWCGEEKVISKFESIEI